MNIEKKLRKKINAICILSGRYPEQMRVTEEEMKQIEKELGQINTFEGVKIVVCKN